MLLPIEFPFTDMLAPLFAQTETIYVNAVFKPDLLSEPFAKLYPFLPVNPPVVSRNALPIVQFPDPSASKLVYAISPFFALETLAITNCCL